MLYKLQDLLTSEWHKNHYIYLNSKYSKQQTKLENCDTKMDFGILLVT